MKRRLLFIFLLICMLLPLSVEAKEIETTCVYDIKVEDAKFDTYTCNLYDDNSQKCVLSNSSNSKTNNENMTNWGGGAKPDAKAWYKSNKKCIPYIVYIEKDALVNNFEVVGFYDLSDAMTKTSERLNFYNKVGYFEVNTVENANLSETDKLKNKINEYVSYFDNFDSKSAINKYCVKDKDGVYVVSDYGYNQELCRKQKAAELNQIQTWDSEVQNGINANYLNKNDQLVKNYLEKRNKIVSSLGKTSFDEEKNETKPIDFTDNNSSNSNNNNNNDNNGNNIDNWETTELNLCQDPDFIRILMLVKTVVSLIMIGTAVVLIIMGMISIAKAVTDEKGDLEKPLKKFKNQIILAVIVLLLPTLINWIFFTDNFITDKSSVLSECISNMNEDRIKELEETINKVTTTPSNSSSSTSNNSSSSSNSSSGGGSAGSHTSSSGNEHGGGGRRR